jgi:hypothetical protein
MADSGTRDDELIFPLEHVALNRLRLALGNHEAQRLLRSVLDELRLTTVSDPRDLRVVGEALQRRGIDAATLVGNFLGLLSSRFDALRRAATMAYPDLAAPNGDG